MDVYVVQPTSMPCNEHMLELLIMTDALKRASARCITAVVPYYAYARQDRKTSPRTPISAKLVADLITTAGANRMITMDLHTGQIQGFFNIPVDHLYAAPVTLEYIRQNFATDLVIVSPDAGGVERARALMRHGARAVHACVTHPVMAPNAISKLQGSMVQTLAVTDTIPLRPEAAALDKMRVLSVAPLLGEAIKRIHNQDSVSSLFV
jgi:ribose-phosphate pyrophosphokinase